MLLEQAESILLDYSSAVRVNFKFLMVPGAGMEFLLSKSISCDILWEFLLLESISCDFLWYQGLEFRVLGVKLVGLVMTPVFVLHHGDAMICLDSLSRLDWAAESCYLTAFTAWDALWAL